MLGEIPTWTFTSKQPLTRWFEYVRLLPDRVVGQWFCVDRPSGARLWEHSLERPDEIVGIEDGIIVANERWRQSFSSAKCGCYGISLETGKLHWTSHASGFRGWVLRVLDFLPGYHNIPFRDCPVYVLDGRCYCRSGRILDVKTGRLVGRVPKEGIKSPEEPHSDTDVLARSRDPADSIKLNVGEGLWLSHESDSAPAAAVLCEFPAWAFEFRLSLTDDEGQVKWEFDLKDTGFEMRYCPYNEKSRYSPPYLYLLACEKRTSRTENKIAVFNPTQFHLLTLNLTTGCIIQDIQITRKPVDECRIEAIDESGILISESGRTLHYFEKS
jgi:hypothetical protein